MNRQMGNSTHPHPPLGGTGTRAFGTAHEKHQLLCLPWSHISLHDLQATILARFIRACSSKKPSTNIYEVTTNENCVAPHCVGLSLKQDIRSMFVSNWMKLFCFQTGNFTASHPNNCDNVRCLFWDSSDIWEVFWIFELSRSFIDHRSPQRQIGFSRR